MSNNDVNMIISSFKHLLSIDDPRAFIYLDTDRAKNKKTHETHDITTFHMFAKLFFYSVSR